MEPFQIREIVCRDTRGILHTVRIMQTLRFLGQDAAKSGKWIQTLHYVVDGLHAVDHNKAAPNRIEVPGTDIVIQLPDPS